MPFEIALLPAAQADLEYWKSTSPKTVDRIARLLQDIAEHPFTGIGKPEALRWNLSGYWSRRINATDRIVYRVNGIKVIVYVLSLRTHYQ
ncbi:MAG: Txe/YoeB family addiction module toxin [Bacteroidales bacterium]|nr:Txe/YoeB family addiction module toxin [Bacteroidales bacterium]